MNPRPLCQCQCHLSHWQCAPQAISSQGVLVILSRYTIMPSLVNLAKKLPAWRIPRVLSAPPPGTCALYRSAPVTTMAHARSKRSTKCKPRLSKWLTYSLGKMSSWANYVHVPCTCSVHLWSGSYTASLCPCHSVPVCRVWCI